MAVTAGQARPGRGTAPENHEADGPNRIREMVKTEWGVADERGGITACESEQAARQLSGCCGG